MKSLAEPILAHLDTGATTLARCWRITRADGDVLGFTGSGTNLNAGTITAYTP